MAAVHAAGSRQQGTGTADPFPLYSPAEAPPPRKLSWGASPSSRPRTAQLDRPASLPTRGPQSQDPLAPGSNPKETQPGEEDQGGRQTPTLKADAPAGSSPQPPGGREAARKQALREVLSFVLGESGARLDHFQMTPQVSVGWRREDELVLGNRVCQPSYLSVYFRPSRR